MLTERPQPVRIAVLSAAVVLVAGAAWLAYEWARQPTVVTAESYVAAKPGRVLASPAFTIANRPARCADAKVVLDPGLDDLAAAYPGVIILNIKYIDRLPEVVSLFAFGHECGHHLHGPDERKADCYAAMRGEAQGWLTPGGVTEICTFWQKFAGDEGHLPGKDRCELMRRCLSQP